jgi:hypothetical protein
MGPLVRPGPYRSNLSRMAGLDEWHSGLTWAWTQTWTRGSRQLDRNLDNCDCLPRGEWSKSKCGSRLDSRSGFMPAISGIQARF